MRAASAIGLAALPTMSKTRRLRGPDTRRRVLLGTIRLDRLAANTPEQDRAAQFNPGNLPAGIEMADDMVRLRAAAYPISVKERQ